MNEELGTIWNEVVVAYSRYYPGIFQEELRNTTKNLNEMSAALGEIRNSHFQNTCLQHYRYANRLGL
jgi:hypothetical protein